MKLFLFALLFCCALTAHVSAEGETETEPGHEGILESIKKMIQNAIVKGKQAIMDSVAQITDLKDSFKDGIEYVIKKSTDELNKTIADIQKEITDFGQESAEAKQCVEKYAPDLVAYQKDSAQALIECGKNALKIGSDIFEAIEKPLEAAKQNIKDLAAVTVQCFNPLKPVSSFVCAVKETKKITDSIFGVIRNSSTAVKDAILKTAQVNINTTKCVAGVIETTAVQPILIYSKIKSCILDGQK